VSAKPPAGGLCFALFLNRKKKSYFVNSLIDAIKSTAGPSDNEKAQPNKI